VLCKLTPFTPDTVPEVVSEPEVVSV